MPIPVIADTQHQRVSRAPSFRPHFTWRICEPFPTWCEPEGAKSRWIPCPVDHHGMVIDMNESQLRTIAQSQELLYATAPVLFSAQGTDGIASARSTSAAFSRTLTTDGAPS